MATQVLNTPRGADQEDTESGRHILQCGQHDVTSQLSPSGRQCGATSGMGASSSVEGAKGGSLLSPSSAFVGCLFLCSGTAAGQLLSLYEDHSARFIVYLSSLQSIVGTAVSADLPLTVLSMTSLPDKLPEQERKRGQLCRGLYSFRDSNASYALRAAEARVKSAAGSARAWRLNLPRFHVRTHQGPEPISRIRATSFVPNARRLGFLRLPHLVSPHQQW